MERTSLEDFYSPRRKSGGSRKPSSVPPVQPIKKEEVKKEITAAQAPNGAGGATGTAVTTTASLAPRHNWPAIESVIRAQTGQRIVQTQYVPGTDRFKITFQDMNNGRTETVEMDRMHIMDLEYQAALNVSQASMDQQRHCLEEQMRNLSTRSPF